MFRIFIMMFFFSFILTPVAFTADWNKFDSIAKQQIGVRYKFGGSTPKKGFDCSGLVGYVYSKIGKALPRSTKQLKNFGKKISKKDIQPGDLIFFAPEKSISHVGIYLGDGVMVHAPSSGKNVTVLNVFEHIYWSKKIAFIKRVVPDSFFN